MSKYQNYINRLLNQGYVIIPKVISQNECKKLKSICKYNYAKFKKKSKINNPLEETIYNLHNKNNIFIKYIDHKKITKIIFKALSSGSYNNQCDIVLRQMSARNPLKGAAQQLHNDTRIVGCKFPLVIHAMYMLDDFTNENGSTRLVPKSQMFLKYAKKGESHKNEKIIKGKKGTVLLFDASMWHGSCKKITDEDRWGMIYSYSRWFLKTDFDFTKNTPKCVYNKLSLNQKKLLGFCHNPPIDEFERESAINNYPDKPNNYSFPV
jgi:ectoine hydroxylase-related dioxygenase (phytanoyl-CoA dioxygenase family)